MVWKGVHNHRGRVSIIPKGCFEGLGGGDEGLKFDGFIFLSSAILSGPLGEGLIEAGVYRWGEGLRDSNQYS